MNIDEYGGATDVEMDEGHAKNVNGGVNMKLYLSSASDATANAAMTTNDAVTDAGGGEDDAEAERRRRDAFRRSYDEGLDLMSRTSAFLQHYCGRSAMPFINEAAAAAAAVACQQNDEGDKRRWKMN